MSPDGRSGPRDDRTGGGRQPMSGETDLDVLLASMQPMLREGEFVFCSLDREPNIAEMTAALATFRETEGTTLVVAAADASGLGLASSGAMACITLTVHSSLDAVGLTAAVATCLTDAGISCNVIAAFHHDHLFVPTDRAADAIAALTALSAGSTTM